MLICWIEKYNLLSLFTLVKLEVFSGNVRLKPRLMCNQLSLMSGNPWKARNPKIAQAQYSCTFLWLQSKLGYHILHASHSLIQCYTILLNGTRTDQWHHVYSFYVVILFLCMICVLVNHPKLLH